MEKYASFEEITSTHLHGELKDLNITYSNSNTMNVTVAYEYNNYYTLVYKVVVELKDKTVTFVRHSSNSGLNKTELSREVGFEDAIANYFFS